jgi:hypothetical protein
VTLCFFDLDIWKFIRCGIPLGVARGTIWPRFSASRNDLWTRVKIKHMLTLRLAPSTEFRCGSTPLISIKLVRQKRILGKIKHIPRVPLCILRSYKRYGMLCGYEIHLQTIRMPVNECPAAQHAKVHRSPQLLVFCVGSIPAHIPSWHDMQPALPECGNGKFPCDAIALSLGKYDCHWHDNLLAWQIQRTEI